MQNIFIKTVLLFLTGALIFLFLILRQRGDSNEAVVAEIASQNDKNRSYNQSIKKFNDGIRRETESLKSVQNFRHYEILQREKFSKIADGEVLVYTTGVDLNSLPDIPGLDEALREGQPEL